VPELPGRIIDINCQQIHGQSSWPQLLLGLRNKVPTIPVVDCTENAEHEM
jgi:hypothetical protein